MQLHRMLQACFLFSLVWLSQQCSTDVTLQALYSWQWIDFAFESPEQRSEAIQNGQFIPETVILMDTDSYTDPNTEETRVFVTTPATGLEGNPATLSVVITDQDSGAVLLQPYPSWQDNDRSSCDALISVFRIQIDQCGNLWAVDLGVIDGFGSNLRLCPTKLVIYDLKNQDSPNVLVRYEFNEQSLKPTSRLLNLIVESTADDCSDAVAYIADVQGFGIIVYDMVQNTSWRVDHTRFYLYPDWVDITINGFTFPSPGGVMGLALSPLQEDNSRILYCQSYSSVVESWISTTILKDQNAIADSQLLNAEIKSSGLAREGQSTVSVITSDGIMIYALVTKNALACWNTAVPYTKENQHIIFQDETNLKYISGMKLRGQELLITSSDLPAYSAGALVEDEIKYQIFSIANVADLLLNTPCEELC